MELQLSHDAKTKRASVQHTQHQVAVPDALAHVTLMQQPSEAEAQAATAKAAIKATREQGDRDRIDFQTG